MDNKMFLGRTKKLMQAYDTICKPYAQKMGLSVQAFTILMFISKNQGPTTAQDICKNQNIKPTLVSFHIDKLVQGGFIERQEIDGNRRSIKLVCTEKAAPVIQKGREINRKYLSLIWKDISEEEIKQFKQVLDKFDKNAENIINKVGRGDINV